ncbi:MAG: hypothetical protein ACREDK_04970 [Thermoplasmata archaeon]
MKGALTRLLPSDTIEAFGRHPARVRRERKYSPVTLTFGTRISRRLAEPTTWDEARVGLVGTTILR